VSKSKRERSLETEERADTPTVRELYIIIMELATKYNNLEQKMNEMTKWVAKKKQTMKITEWMNSTFTDTLEYYDWLAQIKLNRVYLEYIFNEDYVGGMLATLCKLLEGDKTTLPLRAFSTKDNALYAYTAKDKWTLLDDNAITKMLNTLDKQMMDEFVKWQNENKAKMSASDDFAVLYATNVKKIMGGNNTRDQLFSRIKRELFKHLRVDPPNIMEYEIAY
jgi:hypothetical protein